MNNNKPKIPKRKFVINFKCVKCGYIYKYNWTYRISIILTDPKKLAHHEIKKKIHNIKCPKCDIQFDVTKIELYRKINNELRLVYEENVNKSYYKPAEFYNMEFGSKDSGVGANISSLDVNTKPKQIIRERACPTCGHRYKGSPICPMRSMHKKSRKSSSHRLSIPKDAAEKEFLKDSPNKHIPIEKE